MLVRKVRERMKVTGVLESQRNVQWYVCELREFGLLSLNERRLKTA